MGYKFTFDRGTWKDGNQLPELEDGESVREYNQRIGFMISATNFGSAQCSNIEIYEALNTPSFYADVNLESSAIYQVYFPDFPSCMMFIRDHASAFSTASFQELILEMVESLKIISRQN